MRVAGSSFAAVVALACAVDDASAQSGSPPPVSRAAGPGPGDDSAKRLGESIWKTLLGVWAPTGQCAREDLVWRLEVARIRNGKLDCLPLSPSGYASGAERGVWWLAQCRRDAAGAQEVQNFDFKIINESLVVERVDLPGRPKTPAMVRCGG